MIYHRDNKWCQKIAEMKMLKCEIALLDVKGEMIELG